MAKYVHTFRSPAPCVWLLYGPGFRLPLQVTWADWDLQIADVRLHPAIPWLGIWKEQAARVLNKLAIAHGEDCDGIANWMYEREGLAQVAVPWKPASDPNGVSVNVAALEATVYWATEQVAHALPSYEEFKVAEPETAGRIRTFLGQMVDKLGLCGFETVDELELFYYLLCNWMARALEYGTEPVEMVFCRLIPLPFKPGWQAAARARAWKKHETPGTVAGTAAGTAAWQASRYGEYMGCEKLGSKLRSAKAGTFHQAQVHRWGIELQTSKSWRRSSGGNQRRLLDLLGEYGYFTSNRERIEQVWPWLCQALKEWYREKQAPGLAQFLSDFRNIEIGVRTGAVRKTRNRRKGATPSARATILGINARRRRAKQERAEALARAAADLPEMPDLQQAAPDLRDGGGDVGGAEVRDRRSEVGAARLLVYIPGQGEVGDGDVLGEGEGI